MAEDEKCSPTELLGDFLSGPHEPLVFHRFPPALSVGVVEEWQSQEDSDEPRRRPDDL